MTADEFLTINEAAAELGRSPSAVRGYVNNHGLPGVRRGSQTFVRKADLAAWKADPDHAAMMAAGDRLHRTRKAAAPSA